MLPQRFQSDILSPASVMFANNELAEMLLLCGIEENNRKKAEKMSMVVKILEGEIEDPPPPNLFAHWNHL